jgi:hypothetical protein
VRAAQHSSHSTLFVAAINARLGLTICRSCATVFRLTFPCCQAMADIRDEDFRHFVCVESGSVRAAVTGRSQAVVRGGGWGGGVVIILICLSLLLICCCSCARCDVDVRPGHQGLRRPPLIPQRLSPCSACHATLLFCKLKLTFTVRLYPRRHHHSSTTAVPYAPS